MSKTYAKYIRNEYITFKYAKGNSDRSGREFHPYHEILLFLGGEADFISENIHTTLNPNTLIIIPSETYHQFLIKGAQEDYHRCVLQFFDTEKIQELSTASMKEVSIIETNDAFQFLFRKLIALTEKHGSKTTDSMVLESILSLILNELATSDILHTEAMMSSDSLSERCIAYITAHISDSISIETIANDLNVSVSCLAHTFKKQMNISIHQFILKKRLVIAHHKILAGEPATKVAMEYGFNDYSGFYKQYKKLFGKNPSCREPVGF